MNKESWLSYLFYELGGQNCDFELQILEKDGKRSKRKKYSEVCFDSENRWNKWFISKVNQRQILPFEIVLDFEDKERLPLTVKELQELKIIFYVFSTGSRGYHVHTFYNKNLSEQEKLKIIKHFLADTQLASNRHMIALEFAPHWKSGKIKELIQYES
jgi:hypothetical protein